MGWMARRRAMREYREGTITLNQMLEAHGLQPVSRDDFPEPKAMVYYQPVRPLHVVANKGDLWFDTSIEAKRKNCGDPVMSVYNGDDWEPVHALPRSGMTIGPEGMQVWGGTMGTSGLVADAAAAAADASTMASTVAPKNPNWREEFDEALALGDNGLAALLWGRDLTTHREAKWAADAVEAAGWRSTADASLLARVLTGNDCRDFGVAQHTAGLVEALGWERHEPGPGVGWMGRGSNALTEDEEAAVRWRLARGHDPVHLFNSILIERPLDVGPQQGALPSDGSADYAWTPDAPTPFVDEAMAEKDDDPRQPWLIVSDLYDAVESLLLDPDQASEPHCVEEYNAGLLNALGILREQCEALGGHIDRPEPGDEPEPSLGPDVEAIRAALRRAGQKMMDDMGPLINAARFAGLVQPQVKVEVPKISEEDMERISARVAEAVGPLLAAVAAANAKAPKRPKPKREE